MSESPKKRSLLTFILLTIAFTVLAVLLVTGVQLLIFGKTARVVSVAVGVSSGLGAASVFRRKMA